MGHHHVEIPTDVEIPASNIWSKVWLIGLVVGLLGIGVSVAGYGSNHEHYAYAYLFAFTYWLTFALGCTIFVIIQHVAKAGWSISVRRIGETGMATLPLFALLALPIIFVFAHDLYPWTHAEHLDEILIKKKPYLNQGFWTVRSLVYIVAWSAMSMLFYRWSVSQDGGQNKETSRKMIAVGCLCVPLYALTTTFASFDWLMSLQPHWYSTIFGVYFFAGCILAAYTFMPLIVMGLQKTGLMKTALNAEHFHDLGKLAFGHTVFWAYIAFSQFMIIWYANIPEEVEFFYHRIDPAHGWATMSYLLPSSNFFIPFFFLLSRHIKRRKLTFAIGCFYTLVVHIIDIYWLIMPMAGQNHGHTEHFPSPLIWVDACLWVGIGGLFFAAFGFILKRNKIVAVGDPRIEESLNHVNF